MKDREVVYQSIVSRTGPKTVQVEMKSIEHPQAPRAKDWIRSEIVFTRYQVEQINLQQIGVTFENLSKPGGDVPRFLSNWASRTYPITILEGLQRELKKEVHKKAPLPWSGREAEKIILLNEGDGKEKPWTHDRMASVFLLEYFSIWSPWSLNIRLAQLSWTKPTREEFSDDRA